MSFDTPILFLIFNRIDTSKKVFNKIRDIRPSRLYISSDGPRNDLEKNKIKNLRDYLQSSIDWDCKVETLFRDENLGCKMAVSSAINWFFENEEMGIILEDDCLPSTSFFYYCGELLNKYKEDERIFLISGHNSQEKWLGGKGDYFFSHFGGIWGWASWRRAWNNYDIEAKDLNEFIDNDGFRKLLGNKLGKIRQKEIYEHLVIRKANTWAYQWAYTRLKNGGLACVPRLNLIENIGFDVSATHTTELIGNHVMSFELTFPLSENDMFVPEKEYDLKFISSPSIYKRIFHYVKRRF